MPHHGLSSLVRTRGLGLLVAGLLLGALPLRAQIIYITELTAGSPSVAAYDMTTKQAVDVGSALTGYRSVGNGHFYGGIGTDPAGNVYVAAPDGYIYKYDNTGAAVTAFGTSGSVYGGYNSIVTGGTVNPAGTQFLLPYNLYTSAVYAFNTTTGAPVGGFTGATVATGQPWAVAFNASGTAFYATNGSTGTPSSITQFSLTGGTGTQLTVASSPGNLGLSYARGLVFQSDTSFLVADTAQSYLVRYTISGGSVALDPTFGSSGYISVTGLTGGLTLDASGNIYALTDNGTNSYVEQFSANGSLLNGTYLTLPTSGGYSTYHGGLAIGIAPVPEPQTLALLAGGLLLLGLRQRRRRETVRS
jgi:hypothetical protein